MFETDGATLVYRAQSKAVHHTIHKPISGTTFRELLTRGVEIFERRGATKWLSDDRASVALHPDEGKWCMEVWSPRAIAAGWTHWAIVMPDAALGRANMRRFIREYADRGVDVKIFASTEGALEWLVNPAIAIAV